jgi:hypothetical protein
MTQPPAAAGGPWGSRPCGSIGVDCDPRTTCSHLPQGGNLLRSQVVLGGLIPVSG